MIYVKNVVLQNHNANNVIHNILEDYIMIHVYVWMAITMLESWCVKVYTNFILIECDSKCKTCQDAITCTSCDDTQFRTISFTNTCVC